MTVTTIRKDPEKLTMTITVELAATPERCWQLWADPRQLERWWGPPTYPATFVDHDLSTGGRVTHYMTGPDGEKHHGVWEVMVAEPPYRLELRDADVDDSGEPNDGNALTHMVVTLSERGSGTVMTVDFHFWSVEGMERVSMGMEEGMTQALSRIDAILTETTAA